MTVYRCIHGGCRVFFFNDTATTEIYTLSLHDALPISLISLWLGLTEIHGVPVVNPAFSVSSHCTGVRALSRLRTRSARSEEHTSELQSRQYLVCRLLLEKQ